MENEDLILYREVFAALIKKNDSSQIDNSSRAHARVIIEELVKTANFEILIQCTDFAPDVYSDEMIELLNEAYLRGCDVKIAIRNFVRGANANIKDLVKGIRIYKNMDCNKEDFCVVDMMRYRLEVNAIERKAIACAYDPVLGDDMSTVFNYICKQVDAV